MNKKYELSEESLFQKPHFTSDEELIYLAAMRYCMGRATYMPGVFRDEVKSKWSMFSDPVKEFFIRDLKDEIERSDEMEGPDGEGQGLLGMECDEATWRELLEWMLWRIETHNY